MSKLDEVRNRLRKDAEGGSLLDKYASTKGSHLDKYANSKESIAQKSQSKDVGSNLIVEHDVTDDAPVVFQAHKRAIFIGNDAYEMQRPLNKCVNDARAMQHIFSKIGYRLVYDFNLDSEKMHKLFERFKSDIEVGDELIINFSGHGLQVNSEMYLIPTDAPAGLDVGILSSFINLDKEMDEMLACGAKIVVAVVDACRNQLRIDYQDLGQAAYEQGVEDAIKMGAQANSSNERSSQVKSANFATSKSIGPQGKAVLFASSHDTSATEYSEMQNGVFTHFFLKEVVKPGRTITQVIERVREMVSEYTDGDQIPAFHNNLPGDYYFIDQS